MGFRQLTRQPLTTYVMHSDQKRHTVLLTYLILDEVGHCRRMSFNCPTRYIDPVFEHINGRGIVPEANVIFRLFSKM